MNLWKPAENGAAERNRTSDPVITNEGDDAQTRSFPDVTIPEMDVFAIKVRKSAQENIRKLRLICQRPLQMLGVFIDMGIDLRQHTAVGVAHQQRFDRKRIFHTLIIAWGTSYLDDGSVNIISIGITKTQKSPRHPQGHRGQFATGNYFNRRIQRINASIGIFTRK